MEEVYILIDLCATESNMVCGVKANSAKATTAVRDSAIAVNTLR